MRKCIVWFTLCCFVTTQTAVVAGPHEEGVAAGRAANPLVRGSVTTPSATTVVPGYTTTPPTSAHYRQPNLAAQGQARLALCATLPDDPVCQAQRGALSSANTARPAVTADDPAVAAARAVGRSPSSVLGSLAGYYSGCTTSVAAAPATTQLRSCLRYEGIGQNRCSSSLTVSTSRTTNCNPGDWFAHAATGRVGIDAQCLPRQPDTQQHFRLTYRGSPLVHFDVDTTGAASAPRRVATLDTNATRTLGAPPGSAVWVADTTCAAGTCRLTVMVAADAREVCPGREVADDTCTAVQPFLKTYGSCPAGTQSGDHIQRAACRGDSDCNTSTLDGSTCFAPARHPTPYAGRDVTGTVAGVFWNPVSERPVTGWQVNPAYGALPTVRLRYTLPTMTVSTTDRWDDQCPSLAAPGRCTVDGPAVCTDGPSTKLIDGVPVTRDCWARTQTMSCSGTSSADACASLVAAGCTLTTATTAGPASLCKQNNAATGACEVFEDRYSCPVPAQTVTSTANCPANVFCLGASCFDIGAAKDPDFARSMSLLEAGREAGVYLDTDLMQVFKGEGNRCRDRLLKDCCDADRAGAGMTNQSLFGVGSRLVYDVLMNAENQQFLYHGMAALLTGAGFNGAFTTYGVTVTVNGTALPAGSSVVYAGDSIVVAFDPWTLAIGVVIAVALSMLSCNEEEGKLAMKEGAGLCHHIGSWCSSCLRVLGACVSCIEHTTSKCCFNSMLARIVNEQGRQQIGKGWGRDQQPDCSGFTVAQLQRLDFAAMDLSEFYASLVPTAPDIGQLQGNGANRVPSCYYGQGRCQ